MSRKCWFSREALLQLHLEKGGCFNKKNVPAFLGGMLSDPNIITTNFPKLNQGFEAPKKKQSPTWLVSFKELSWNIFQMHSISTILHVVKSPLAQFRKMCFLRCEKKKKKKKHNHTHSPVPFTATIQRHHTTYICLFDAWKSSKTILTKTILPKWWCKMVIYPMVQSKKNNNLEKTNPKWLEKINPTLCCPKTVTEWQIYH